MKLLHRMVHKTLEWALQGGGVAAIDGGVRDTAACGT